MTAIKNELRVAEVRESEEDSNIIMEEVAMDESVVDSKLQSIGVTGESSSHCRFYLC